MSAMIHKKFGPSTDLWVCEHDTAYPDVCGQCKSLAAKGQDTVMNIDDALIEARRLTHGGTTAKDLIREIGMWSAFAMEAIARKDLEFAKACLAVIQAHTGVTS